MIIGGKYTPKQHHQPGEERKYTYWCEIHILTEQLQSYSQKGLRESEQYTHADEIVRM